MTYCIAVRLNAGLAFLSDSRTNAGVDQVSVFRKLKVFEQPGERMMVLMTAGNLAISQAVVNLLKQHDASHPDSLWQAPDMFEAARRVGDAVREIHRRDAAALSEQGVEFNINIIFGGQIGAEHCRLFQVYAAGNFIEASPDCPYIQIGEAKYGKPILDRLVTAGMTLDEAAKCMLVSMDSTLRSNISVGLPLDLLVYEADSLHVTRYACIDENNDYFRMIHSTWGERLRQVFGEIPDPAWTAADTLDAAFPARHSQQPMRVESTATGMAQYLPLQVLAQSAGDKQAS